MSIYISNLIMPPDDKKDLIIRIKHDGTVLDPWWNLYNTKAIEVPPHGRLIDADAMAAKDNEDYKAAMDTAFSDSSKALFDEIHRNVQNSITNAPTIIPASGGEEADPEDPADPVVAEALKHGFYGTMYWHPGEKVIFIKPGEAQAVKDGLFFQWGYPGLEYNIYKPEDYGKTWALTEDDWALTEDVVAGIIPADREEAT